VYFIPPATLVCPAFLQAAPALTAADEPGATTIDKTNAIATATKDFFMSPTLLELSPTSTPKPKLPPF
jgi:hypothetical protein